MLCLTILVGCVNESGNENLVRMDMISSELNLTNNMMEEMIGLEYVNFYNAENYDSLKFGGIIRELDQVYKKIMEQSGGFVAGYEEWKLYEPANTSSIEYYIKETDLLNQFKKELTISIDLEQDQLTQSELIRIRDEIFGDDIDNNTAAEFRLRYFITKNRLYLLEQLSMY